MQPYSELANWDGSLSVRVPPSASSLSSPPTPTNRFGDISVMHSPPPPPSLTLIDKGISLLSQTDRDHTQPQSPSIYDIYHKFLPQSNQQANRPIAHPFTTSSDPSFPFEPPSHALFPLNGHELVLSQQERQIMADITLDPDDPTACTWTENDASLSNKDSNSKLFQTRSQSATAVTQRPVPTPTAVASVSASVSPSPFAPPASIAVPPASSSSSSKETNKLAEVKIMYPHNLATFVGLKERTTTENVINHTSPSASRGGEEAKLRDPSLKASLQRRESTRPCEIEMLVVNSHDLDPSQNQAPLLNPSKHSTSYQSSAYPRRASKTPLFLPSPSESRSSTRHPSEPQPGRGRGSDPPDVISIGSSSSTSSSPPPPPPPRRPPRSTRESNKSKRQLMAYILVPPLPPGMRKSDYVPLGQLLRMRERRARVKREARVGDNTGPTNLAVALQGAFENNSSGVRSEGVSNARRRKKKAVLELMNDKKQGKSSKALARALTTAFAHNSADPRVAATSSAPAITSGSTRRSRRHGRPRTLSDSVSVEVVVLPPPTKRFRTRARAHVDDSPLSSSAHAPPRQRTKRRLHASTSPRRKRRRVNRRGDALDERELDADDDVVEIVADAPRESRRAQSAMPRNKHQPPQFKLRHASQRSVPSPVHTSISIPTRSHSPSSYPQPQSPVTPPDVNTLAGLPLTILPAPAPADIVIPHRALNHLHASPGPPDLGAEAKMSESESGNGSQGENESQTLIRILQGFRNEEAVVGAHGLLAFSTSAPATVTTAVGDSSACTTTADPQQTTLDLDLDAVIVPMAIGDGDGGGEPARERQVPDQVEASDVVVPPHALRISAAAHPEGPMLGFLLPEPGVGASADVDTDASSIGADIGVNMGSDLGFFLDTLSPRPGAGAGWIDWGTGQVFSAAATGISTSMAAAGEYTGDGTIDPSVLGGNIGSPGKFRLDMNHAVAAGSPSGYAMNNEDEDVDMDEEEEEEDVIGMLFEDPIDGDGDDLGSKGKSKATVNPQRIGARIRRKSWRKALGDEQTEQSVKKSGGRDEYKNKYQEGPSAPASMSLRLRSPTRPARGSIHSSMPAEMTFCHHCRRKTRRPKMHCTRIKESTGQRCRKAFCDLCIEKRYPELTFDVLVPAFACPSCRNFCNCSHCSRARGEAYVPERNGGWRKWGTSPKTRAIADNSNDKGPAKARKRARTSSATVEKVLKGPSLMKTYEARSTALFTVSGEPLGEVFLNGGNVAHVVLTQQQPIMKAPSASSASAPQLTLKTPAPPATSVPVPRRKRRIHVYIGKQLKAWGRVVLIPEPNEEKQKQKKKARAGRGKGKRTRMRVRLFVGSEEPLLLGCMGKRQKRSASLALALTSASGVEDDEDVDVEGVDEGCEGVWPGEYAILPGSVDGPPSQPPPSTTDLSSNTQTALRITPDEVERAIGAAFAAGTQQPQGIDKF